MLSQTPSSVTGCSGACWQEKGHFWEKNKLDIEAPTATKTIFFVASDSNWSQCKAVLSEIEFPCWEHSRVIPLECFFPPSTTTPWFFLCLFTYLNTSCLSKGSCLPTKKIPYAKTKYFKMSQNNQGHPSLQQTPKWDELQVWCGSDALTCVRWAQITLLAFTGVVNCHRTLAQGKGKHRNWNKACSQSAVGSQPLFYSEVLKLVKLIHHKLCVYKVKCPGKWDCSANNAVLDGAVKGHNSQWDDYVSQLLRWITKFTFQYLVILGGFSLGMKLTEIYFS